MLKHSLLIFLLICSFSQVSHSQEWLADWMKNSLGATSFQSSPFTIDAGTKDRPGRIGGGRFSIRFQGNPTLRLPITAEAPRLNIGCNGIDFATGAINLANLTDKLPQMLQGLLQSSAMVALDLGIRTLCEECADAMKTAQQIVDRINGLQISSCDAANFLAEESGLKDWSAKYKEEQIREDRKNHSDFNPDQTFGLLEQPLEKCEGLSNLLLGQKDPPKNIEKQSFIEQVTTEMGIPSMASTVRGITGDLYVSLKDNIPQPEIISPCSKNKNIYDALYSKKFQERDQAQTEKCEEKTKTSVRDTIKELSQQIITKAKTRDATLSQPEKNFLSGTPYNLREIALYTSLNNIPELPQEFYDAHSNIVIFQTTKRFVELALAVLKGYSETIEASKNKCPDADYKKLAEFKIQIDKALEPTMQTISDSSLLSKQYEILNRQIQKIERDREQGYKDARARIYKS